MSDSSMNSDESIESSKEAYRRPSVRSGFFRPNKSETPEPAWDQGMYF